MNTLFSNHMKKIDSLDRIFASYQKAGFYQELNIEEHRLKLQSVAQQVNEMKLRFAVIGEFSSGKSSLINAILHQPLLPAAFKPTTNQVMRIEYDEKPHVYPEDEPIKSLPLTTDNIVQLAAETGKSLDIYTPIPEPMNRFVLYDTPGVNDPSALTEEIIFDLLGKSDIVIFMMHANNALKQTELDFLKKLVCKKDLGKFFFVINFKDQLDDDALADLRAHITRSLAEAMNYPKKEIDERVSFYSAKQSLEAIKNSAWEDPAWKTHTHLLDTFSNFARKNREQLEEASIRGAITVLVQQCCQKIDIALDQLSGKDKEYAEHLLKINAEVSAFKDEIQEKTTKFRSDIRTHTREMEDGIHQDLENTKQDIAERIKIMPDSELGNGEWIQKLLRRDIEDVIGARMQQFGKGLNGIYKDFGQAISPELDRRLSHIQGFDLGFNYTPILTGVGLAGAGYLAISTILPWVIFSGGLAGIGAIAAFFYAPNLLPTIGKGASAAVTGLRSLFLGGSKVLVGSYGKIKEPLESWETSKKKQNYIHTIEHTIDTLKMEAIKNIGDQVDPDGLCEAFIEQQFPQKIELEQRLASSDQELSCDRDALKPQIESMQSLKQQISKECGA